MDAMGGKWGPGVFCASCRAQYIFWGVLFAAGGMHRLRVLLLAWLLLYSRHVLRLDSVL